MKMRVEDGGGGEEGRGGENVERHRKKFWKWCSTRTAQYVTRKGETKG